MLFFLNFRCLLLNILLVQLNIDNIMSIWPSSNESDIYLLGLFAYTPDASDNDDLAIHSRAMFKAAVLLSNQYNITIDGKLIGWKEGLTMGDEIVALNETCLSISESNIVSIVGPEFSRETLLISPLCKKLNLPVISYSATDPDLSDATTYSNFYRTVPSDDIIALALLKLFNRFNWASCLIIYQDDAFGSGGAKVINELFNASNIKVVQMIVYDMVKKSIRGNLKTYLMNSPSRIVILWADSISTSSIVQNALDSNVVGPLFTWIITSEILLNSFNESYYDDLVGMLLIEPVVASVVGAPYNTELLNAAYNIWQIYENETFPGSTHVNYYALFSFDATWALIKSLEELCSSKINNSSSSCLSFKYIGSGYWRITITQNPILWPRNSLTPSVDRAVLRGVSLRIGIAESAPFGMLQNVTDENGQTTIQYTGYAIDLYQLLKDQLGFNATLLLKPPDQTYTDFVLSVSEGVYDIIIADVTVTSARSKIVDFSSPIYDNSLRLVVRQANNAGIDLFAFLKPFSYRLWILVLGTCIYAGILMLLIERRKNEDLQNRSIISQLTLSIWYCFGYMVGFGSEFNARTAGGRLLTAGLYILCLILVASYTANLASDLTVTKSQFVISGIDDIKSGTVPINRVGIYVGTATEDYIKTVIPAGRQNFYPVHSFEELYDSLLAGLINVFLLDEALVEYALNNIYCNLTIVGSPVAESSYAIVTPKKWLYASDLDVSILAIREAGQIDGLKQKWLQTGTCPDSTPTSTSFDIEAISGLFVTFAVITALSLLLFLWTERRDIKEYLSQLIYKKDSLAEERCSATRNSNRNYEYE
ncbi:unnamed protein product, partial [Rotaria sp. Silwood2]